MSAKDTKTWRQRNPKKAKEARAKHNAKYYKFQFCPNSKKPYTDEEIEAILNKSIPDKQLADTLGRSVKAIELKRHFLKKERKND